jgi:hypothetical protein
MDRAIRTQLNDLERAFKERGLSAERRLEYIRKARLELELKLHESRNLSIFDSRPASDWVAAEDPPARRLFGDLWREGELAILFADTGVGKSILAVQIADGLTRGLQFPPLENESEPQRVLYLDFELSGRQFAERYSQGPDRGGKLRRPRRFSPLLERSQIFWEGELPLGFDSVSEFLLSSIVKLVDDTGARILIIDNVSYLNDSTASTGPALRLMKILKDLKTKHELSILVLAHSPKRPYARAISLNDLQGSKMLSNFADNIFAIGRSLHEPDIRYIKHIKPRQSAITYDASNVIVCRIVKKVNFPRFDFEQLGNESWYIHRPQANPNNDPALIRAVRDLHQTGQSQRHIARQLRLSPSTVHKYIHLPPPTEAPTEA